MKGNVKYIILGVVIFVAGAVATPIVLVTYLFTLEDQTQKFKIPGRLEVSIEEPGKYYLWNEYRCVFEGKTHSSSRELPNGIFFELVGMNTSEKPPLNSNQSMSVSSGNDLSVSIGYYKVTQPDDYILEVFGETEERIFSFGTSRFSKIMIAVATGGAISMVVSLTGIAVVIYGIVQLVKKKKAARE
jgi:hypothetical protein